MPEAPDSKPVVHRRGPDGRMEVGPDWETLIERQIREAMEAGEFDNLPLQGAPLPIHDNPYAGDWGLAFHLLGNAGVAPPWIEADKELRELLRRREAILARAATEPAPSAFARRRDRAALEELVARINGATARVNAEAPTDRQHRRPLALADELARFDEACCR
jgi:DnaJ homologue, subfamily C, member 28, conserved domain